MGRSTVALAHAYPASTVLGIDPHKTYFPRLPRPTPITDGQVIDGLFS